MMAVMGDRRGDRARHVEAEALHKAVDNFAGRPMALYEGNTRNVLARIGRYFAVHDLESGRQVAGRSLVFDDADYVRSDQQSRGRNYAKIIRFHRMPQADRVLYVVGIRVSREIDQQFTVLG